jgi:hypothetical protein
VCPVCTLSGFPTLFTSDSSSVNLQVYSNLGFGILLLLRLILLVFLMLILWVLELTEGALLVHVIFLDLLLFVGLLASNLMSHNPP